MIWRKVFGRLSNLGGRLFGVAWTRWSSIFLKHPFCQAFILLIILSFKPSWTSWCGKEFRSPNSRADFCLLLCQFLLLLWTSYLGHVCDCVCIVHQLSLVHLHLSQPANRFLVIYYSFDFCYAIEETEYLQFLNFSESGLWRWIIRVYIDFFNWII